MKWWLVSGNILTLCWGRSFSTNLRDHSMQTSWPTIRIRRCLRSTELLTYSGYLVNTQQFDTSHHCDLKPLLCHQILLNTLIRVKWTNICYERLKKQTRVETKVNTNTQMVIQTVKQTAIIPVFIVFLWQNLDSVCVGPNITADCVAVIKLITVINVSNVLINSPLS